MSDENGELGADQEATELEISGDDLSGITDPALVARLENIHRSMSTLGMRIDSLVTSTTSYRSALTDRLTEYAELVTALTRSQASELEEHRRANEKALTELRRSLTTSEESIERVGARIDSMVTDAESTDDASRRALAEVRSILDAQESLGRFLTESLDTFADEVTGRLSASEQAAADRLEQVRAAMAEAQAPDESGSVRAVLEELRDTLQDLASGEVMGALWDEFRELRADIGSVTDELDGRFDQLADNGTVAAVSAEIRQLRTTLDGLVARVDAAVEADPGPDAHLPDEVTQLNEAVRTLLDQAVVDGDDDVADPRFESLLADVAALREDLAAGLVVEASDDMGTALETFQRQVTGLGDRLEDRLGPQLERLGWRLDEISNRLDDLAAAGDPDVVDLLREEIRASGEPAAGLIADLNTELKALRRRIRLRAEGEILSVDQLETIAESVARRLATED